MSEFSPGTRPMELQLKNLMRSVKEFTVVLHLIWALCNYASVPEEVLSAARNAMGWETWEKAAQAVFGMGGLFTLPRTRGTNTQPLLEPARLREAIEPAQGEGIEPAHGEENQEIEPAHDAAGGEQYQPLRSMSICTC